MVNIMEIQTWALAPIEACVMEANCSVDNRAGMYTCNGCLGNGSRIDTENYRPTKVTIDANNNAHILS